MFRSKRGSDATAANAGEPVEELGALLDKVQLTVDKSMQRFVDSIAPIQKNNGDNNPEDTSPRRSLFFKRGKAAEEDSTSNKGAADSPGEKKTADEDAVDAADAPKIPSPPEDAFGAKENKSSTINASPNVEKKSSFSFHKEPKAKFVPMPYTEMAQLVETVRRIAELVVIGESAAATLQSCVPKLDAKEKHFADNEATDEEKEKDEEYVELKKKVGEQEKYGSIFELFFERNGLELITDVLTGKAFDLPTHIAKREQDIEGAIAVIQNNVEDLSEETKLERMDRCETKLRALDELKEMKDYHDLLLLPPLAVTIQGYQSVSILVQNVKRATSLFFILSNNHINQLINFPLDEYHVAEKIKLESIGGPNASTTNTLMSPRRFGSPELAELTTTFVTFLKSLALRMNAETLQFFLTYPSETTIEGDTDYVGNRGDDEDFHDAEEDGERPLDEVKPNRSSKQGVNANRPVSVKAIEVEFPLYERTLEFCSAHQDSFVRVTAMNICLNTLRLTTVAPKQGEADPEVDMNNAHGNSPDAVLHNAKALPMRERLAIAQYVCTPSRVEKMASPIFTKLAQLWGTLEEQFRDVETSGKIIEQAAAKVSEEDPTARANTKVARAREIARRQKHTTIFSDTSYNLQDELLLLEDVLRVGLTSFNEQTIEMMFATFVYPLLLQPLVLYFQRNPIGAEALFADTLNDFSAGKDVKQSDTSAIEKAVFSAPAKSALFCLAAAFQFITNQPLLRLLFTAVFHPLSPDANSEMMIRAKADVACMCENGKAAIRIDPVDDEGKMICETDRSTYVFGTVTGRKDKCGKTSKDTTEETCVFVLSPALMEILEYRGKDGGIVARSRHNPYRRAILQCFALSKEVSDLQAQAAIAVDSAVSVFDEQFLADILFGLDIKKYSDTLPKDMKALSLRENDDDEDDREMGGPASAEGDPRLSLAAPEGGVVNFDYMKEVIQSFKSCLINAGPAGKGLWRLDYDMVAAHALLTCIRGNPEAIHRASKTIANRCGQAAAFLADTPHTIDRFAHQQLQSVWETIAPKNEGGENARDEALYFGAIMDMIVRGNKPSVLSNFFWLKQDLSKEEEEVPIYVSVSSVGSYNEIGERACTYAPMEAGAAETALKNAVWSTGAWLRMDALKGMLESLSDSKEHVLQNQKLGGFVFNKYGDPIFPYPTDVNTIYSYISSGIDNAMFGVDASDASYVDACPGTVLNLVGKVAFPCVCEVPPSSAPLFSEAGAKVVSQGITWQSLYLVLLGTDLILAEPEKGASGQGRVVTRCKLEDLIIEKDPDDARTDTSARRLIVINYNTDLKPPGLFHFGKAPMPDEQGPFYKVKRWKSGLDIWFENSNALNLAFKRVEQKIAQAKAERGSFIRRYLSSGADAAK
jgi:hypothetical protein